MRSRRKNREDLIAAFKARAAAPLNRQNELLVRHLTCKASLELADALSSAVDRYHAHDAQALPGPTEVLPPLQ